MPNGRIDWLLIFVQPKARSKKIHSTRCADGKIQRDCHATKTARWLLLCAAAAWNAAGPVPTQRGRQAANASAADAVARWFVVSKEAFLAF